MFELRVAVEFPAAHHITGYEGDCARPHGHNWTLEAFVQTEVLKSLGIGLDFKDLKRAIQEVVAAWDHQDLNTLADFSGINPTAETLAQVAFKKIKPLVGAQGAVLTRITIWENPRCSASYWESRP